MKVSYRQRFFLNIALLFTVFTGGVLVFEFSHEHAFRTESLEEQLDAYSEIVDKALTLRGDSLREADFADISVLLPTDLRLTVVRDDGQVVFDNEIHGDATHIENHADRPEIRRATTEGHGSDIRLSASVGKEYFYYAKRFAGGYVRVALPYDIEIKQFLRTDFSFLLFVLGVFALTLLLIHLIAGQFGRSIRRVYDEEQSKIRQLKQEMTGNIAHELRTPVTSIRGYLETVLEQQALSDKHKQYFLHQAYDQTLVLSELIQDMSLLTKMEESAKSFKLEEVQLLPILKLLQKDMAIALQEKHIEVRWDLPSTAVIQGNRNLIYSIFRNLIDNAVRYAGEHIRVGVSLYKEDRHYYYLTFYDTGVGIPSEEHLSRLFERFYRISEGRTRDTGGSGLGLSIVRNAIAFHRGHIIARNRAGGGLEFLFQLHK
jgi:signal transduction histidine kinase